MSDKRTVMTDALETIGMLIDDTQKRDAVHFAVEPVTAGHSLRPGEHVGIFDKKAYTKKYAEDMGFDMRCLLGIVDPFLPGVVVGGKRFWLIVYPGEIISLRHV